MSASNIPEKTALGNRENSTEGSLMTEEFTAATSPRKTLFQGEFSGGKDVGIYQSFTTSHAALSKDSPIAYTNNSTPKTELFIVILVALLLRAAVSQGPFSGMNDYPMHGDFEAQRHWMEITANLPLSEWYQGKSKWNNLQYWGLDYPPLTAYHSYLFGSLFKLVAPDIVALGTSRGMETPETIIWMRFSAILSDALTFIPATVLLFLQIQKRYQKLEDPPVPISKKEIREFYSQSSALLLLTLTSPSLILVDHGHFQFNCVCHGFFVITLYFCEKLDRNSHRYGVIPSICFCCALNFKQMSLYYAPAVFSYFLNWAAIDKFYPRYNHGKITITRLFVLATSVILTFVVIWAPFILSGKMLQVLKRIFPFERGLFEDKVANFWCTTNVILKWKVLFPPQYLPLFALLATVVTIFPSCLTFFLITTRKMEYILLGFFNVSLSFFLFSYQVHEKSILLPLVPCLLIFLTSEEKFYGFAAWFSNFAALSMIPLFFKDGIAFTSYCLLGFHIILQCFILPRKIMNNYLMWIALMIMLITSGCVCFLTSPFKQYPDLFITIHYSYAFLVFSGFWFYGNSKLTDFALGVYKQKVD